LIFQNDVIEIFVSNPHLTSLTPYPSVIDEKAEEAAGGN
jgi:hypothetical protein